ncbi:hypothetical protein KGS77_19640 [Streptomyces sp. MST-110588]|nr:hypothetical protein KGS77_19640 [Streptomyces sp. MST-110588]
MTAHQPISAAARRAERDAYEPAPTMDELLAACAAAQAVSTPPDTPAAGRADGADGDGAGDGDAGGPKGATAASAGERDAA